MATVQMRKGDLYADIFDSPETIAQARREGYSLVDPKEINKHCGDLDQLTKGELLELAKEKGVFDSKLPAKKKGEIIDLIKAALPQDDPEKTEDNPTRDELIQAAIESGFEEASLSGLSDEEIAALLEQE
jgi:hypothetical protein